MVGKPSSDVMCEGELMATKKILSPNEENTVACTYGRPIDVRGQNFP